MARFRWVPVLLLLVALLSAGCAKPAEKQVPPPPSHRPLTIQAAEGDEVIYHTAVKSAFSGRSLNGGQALPAGAPLEGKTVVEYDAHLHFDKVAGSEATITYTLTNFATKTEVAGKEMAPTPGSTGDFRFTLQVDTVSGKLLHMKMDPQTAGLLDEKQFGQTLGRTFVGAPDGVTLEPGSSWTADVPFPIILPGIKGESQVRVTTTYESDETRDAVKVAKLVTTGSGPIAITGEADGITFAVKGALEINGVQYIDHKNGLPRSVESRTTFKFTQSMKEAASGLSIDTEMESVSEVSMVRK